MAVAIVRLVAAQACGLSARGVGGEEDNRTTDIAMAAALPGVSMKRACVMNSRNVAPCPPPAMNKNEEKYTCH